jgi:hypothetical protein
VAGKTGTCIGQGSWLGLFTSYAPLANPRLAVVVIARGSDGRRHFPAAVAGQIYRELNRRFGTPVNLQIANTPAKAEDARTAELNEEEKDAKEAEDAEQREVTAAAEAAAAAEEAAEEKRLAEDEKKSTETTAAAPANVDTAVPKNTVKRVLMPIEKRPAENQEKPAAENQKDETKPEAGAAAPVPNSPPASQRPRRTQPILP